MNRHFFKFFLGSRLRSCRNWSSIVLNKNSVAVCVISEIARHLGETAGLHSVRLACSSYRPSQISETLNTRARVGRNTITRGKQIPQHKALLNRHLTSINEASYSGYLPRTTPSSRRLHYVQQWNCFRFFLSLCPRELSVKECSVKMKARLKAKSQAERLAEQRLERRFLNRCRLFCCRVWR